MTRGILIIALGNENYHLMARNLAISLKYAQPDIKIGLVSLDYHNIDARENLFDDVIIAHPESFTWNGNIKAFIKSKTFMYDFSPFDETLYLDADTIWLPRKKPSDIFDKLKDIDFTISNRGYINLTEDNGFSKQHHKQIQEIKEAYGVRDGFYYSLHSEFIYFKKSDHNKIYFDKVKEVYDNIKITQPAFGGAIPDESAFAIASILLNKYPHQVSYSPNYWEYHDRYKQLTQEQIFNHYYTYSLAGNRFAEFADYKIYNELVLFYYSEMGLENPYFPQDKKAFLKERVTV